MSIASAVASLRPRTRIIAVPLSRPRRLPTTPGVSSAPSGLTYYQFQLASRETKRKMREAEEEADKNRPSWIPKGGLARWAQNKAAETWASFGKAQGGWKRRTYDFGERMADRMEFEELALKSIDPSLGPSLSHPASSEMESESSEGKNVRLRIPLYYPKNILSGETVMSELRQYVDHRIPAHRKGFYMWLAIAPLTAPFMIIPIIPNLPFFFCIWRSWSHYRAFRSSQYLQSLLDRKIIVPESSQELDAIYTRHAPNPSPSLSDPITSPPPSDHSLSSGSSPKSSTNSENHELLLIPTAIPEILEKFELEPGATGDLYRALEQARVRTGAGE
ncbi:hypothetical protein FA13DRAFT_1669596, partial [Coprinellus micaceus]